MKKRLLASLLFVVVTASMFADWSAGIEYGLG